MRKSEMVKKMEIPISILSGGFLTSKEIKKACSSLLSFLEKEGMLPPKNKSKTDTIVHCGTLIDIEVPIHEWDKE